VQVCAYVAALFVMFNGSALGRGLRRIQKDLNLFLLTRDELLISIYILFFPMGFYFYEVATRHGILSYVGVSEVGLRGMFEYVDCILRKARWNL
jgi:hypothetical protein